MSETKAEPLTLLTGVEAAHAEASKAPWGLFGGTHSREVIDDHGCHVATTGTFPDAAWIVAAVNSAPKMAAALRAEWERHRHDGSTTGFCAYDGLVWPCVAHRELTSALGRAR